MLDLVASILVRSLNRVFHILPIRVILWIGARLGILAYFFNPKRARLTYANLKAAFGADKNIVEIKKLAKDVYKNAGMTFAEILSMTKFDKKYIEKYVHVENFERIVKAANNPNGMILISAHFGNWELSTATSVVKGFPLYLLARDQKMTRLNELLNLLRESRGNTVIRKGFDIKNIFRTLRKGKSVGIVADQNAGHSGVLIDFFGRPASMAPGPYRIAQKSGSSILPAFIHRVNGPYHNILIEEEFTIDENDDIRPYMEKYSSILEREIRKYPAQWFWMHKKWKVTPVKTVMVLDDAKRGHLNQSLAVLKAIKDFRLKEGFTEEETKIEVVGIDFKNRFSKFLLLLFYPFIAYPWNLHLKILNLVLTRESYQKAVNSYADVIVSTGSALFAVNRILKIENNARNVTVLDPGRGKRGWFDLVVLPENDLKRRVPEKEAEKIVITALSPNLIDAERLNTIKLEESIREDLAGVLIGGENKFFTFSDAVVNSLIKALGDINASRGLRAFITTSRRTSDKTEKRLKAELGSGNICYRFISGRDDKDIYTVHKILALSKIVIVSGESISMVSEAVASSKPVIIFMPEKKTARFTKYEKFIKGLEDKGYAVIADIDDLALTALDIIGKGKTFSRIDDHKRIMEKAYKLF